MKKYKVTLTAEERQPLHDLIAAGKAAAKKLTHARLLLKADACEGGPAWTDPGCSRIAPTPWVLPREPSAKGWRPLAPAARRRCSLIPAPARLPSMPKARSGSSPTSWVRARRPSRVATGCEDLLAGAAALGTFVAVAGVEPTKPFLERGRRRGGGSGARAAGACGRLVERIGAVAPARRRPVKEG